MAENMLYCAGCNVRFKVKKYDPKRTYNCPKCDQPLKAEGEADTSADGVSLNTQGHIQTDKKKDPLVGRKIAQYKIVRKLGQGGMGSVYEAKHLELGRPVALKLLSPKLAEEDPDAVERFKREARAAAVLNHPNVVIVYSVGSEGPHHFIELEYVDGESLQERVRREKRLSVAEASRITMDAAKGLGAAHRQNFVHRDIKPGNIMLTKDDDSAGAAAGGREGGQVKVMDFGLAKDVTSSAQLTMSGQIMGTPHYMSPEQCDGETLDGRSDIYALGATYYAMLAGRTPYQGSSLLSILRQQADAPVPDVREKCPELSESVQRVIEKAMAKKPEDRFQTMEEFADALAQVQSAPDGGTPDGAVATAGTGDAGGADAPGAALGDMIDADEEREHHLHTARIRGRIKEVEAFLAVWKEFAKAAAAGRRKWRVDDEDEAMFGRLRDTIREKYVGILKRLGYRGAPGQRVTSACDTGVTLTSIAQMPDADYRDLSTHFQTGAKLLYDYLAFLEEGREDLLKQSTLYYYWDKIVHNRFAAGIAGTAVLLLLCLVGWQVVKHLPKGKETPVAKEEPEPAAEQTQTSADRAAPRERRSAESPTPDVAALQLPDVFFNSTDSSTMILIPAGPFTMGRGKEAHAVSLPAYYLSKHEITNRQWKTFVDANPEWRKDATSKRYPGFPYLKHWQGDSYPLGQDDHPAVYVSWFAAKAYCEWAGGRLPTEAEWEKAARGADGRAYPWGNEWDREKCNTSAYWTKKEFPDYKVWQKWIDGGGRNEVRTMKVGSFPQGASPYGLLDMIGNAYEWTSSIRKPYPYVADDGREDLADTSVLRIMRGGARETVDIDCYASYHHCHRPPRCAEMSSGVRLCVPANAASVERAEGPPGVPRRPEGTPKSLTNPTDGAEMVWIPAGRFLMGADRSDYERIFDKFGWNKKWVPDYASNEAPKHQVELAGFWMYAHEVTVAQFAKFVEATGYKTDAEKEGIGVFSDPDRSRAGRREGLSWRHPFEKGTASNPDHPAVHVTWHDAQAYCRWAGTRLPTEAEWEYAARGGDTGLNGKPHHAFAWGSDAPTGPVANMWDETAARERPEIDFPTYPNYDDGYARTAPVGTYPANRFGLFDMAGNVHEWCSDWYGEKYYVESPRRNPQGPPGGKYRVLRDAPWMHAPCTIRVSYRFGIRPEHRNTLIGFRCARTLSPSDREDASKAKAAAGDATPAAAAKLQPTGKTWTNPKDGSEMVLVPAGPFKMGSDSGNDDEKPVHDVHVDAFYIGKYEITNKQWKRFVDANLQWGRDRIDRKYHNGGYLKDWHGSSHRSDRANFPVAYVSWFAAKAYCEWAGGRLPTEAEWEKACRAGSSTKYCFGDSDSQLGQYAWYKANARGSTHTVGRKKCNAWGIHDMHGNVNEWTSSLYKPYPYSASDTRENLTDTSAARVCRGGGWFSSHGVSRCRSSCRSRRIEPSGCSQSLGCRLVVPARAPR